MAQYTKEFPAVYQLYKKGAWTNFANSFDSSETTYASTSSWSPDTAINWMYFNFEELPNTEITIDDIVIKSKRAIKKTDTTGEHRYFWVSELYSGDGENRIIVWSTTEGFDTENESMLVVVPESTSYTPYTQTNTYSASSKGVNSATQAIVDNFTTIASWRDQQIGYDAHITKYFYYSGPILGLKITGGYSSNDVVQEDTVSENALRYFCDYYTSITLTYTIYEQTVTFATQGEGASQGSITVSGYISKSGSSVVTDANHQLVFKATISSSASYYFAGWYLNGVKVSDYYIYRPNPEDVYDGMEIYAQFDSGRVIQRYNNVSGRAIKKFFYPGTDETWTDTEKAYDSSDETFAYGSIDSGSNIDGAKFLTFFLKPTETNLSEIVSIDGLSYAMKRGTRRTSTTSKMTKVTRAYAIELRDYDEDGEYTLIWKNPRADSPTTIVENEDQFFKINTSSTGTIGPKYFSCSNVTPLTFDYSVCDHTIDSFPLIDDWFEEKTTTVEEETFNYVGPCLYSGINKNISNSLESEIDDMEYEEEQNGTLFLDDYYTEFRLSVLAKAHYVYFQVVDKTGTYIEKADIVATSEEGGLSSGTSSSGYVESTLVGWIDLTTQNISSGYSFKEWQVLNPSSGNWVTLSTQQTDYSFNTSSYWTSTDPIECQIRAVLIDQVQITVNVWDEDSGQEAGTCYTTQATPNTTLEITGTPDEYHAFSCWDELVSPEKYDQTVTITVPSFDSTWTAYVRQKSKMVYIGDQTLYAKYSGAKEVKQVFKGDTEIELKVPH